MFWNEHIDADTTHAGRLRISGCRHGSRDSARMKMPAPLYNATRQARQRPLHPCPSVSSVVTGTIALFGLLDVASAPIPRFAAQTRKLFLDQSNSPSLRWSANGLGSTIQAKRYKMVRLTRPYHYRVPLRLSPLAPWRSFPGTEQNRTICELRKIKWFRQRYLRRPVLPSFDLSSPSS